jgi:hypothetical protein
MARQSWNSMVERRPGSLIPGRVLGCLLEPFQRDFVILERSSEIKRQIKNYVERAFGYDLDT